MQTLTCGQLMECLRPQEASTQDTLFSCFPLFLGLPFSLSAGLDAWSELGRTLYSQERLCVWKKSIKSKTLALAPALTDGLGY